MSLNFNVTDIVERLHVTFPAHVMGDGVILDAVRDALLQEPGLQSCTIRVKRAGTWDSVRESAMTPQGVIHLSVTDGVVLLKGHVTSLIQKRLASVLAWWVPGIRDVGNGLEVVPLQEDSDEEIANAVRLVLDKDRFVSAERIRVTVKQAVVTLEGGAPSAPQEEMAELDAWYVFGVDKVDNRLEVRR
ncbi:MAG: BON domain-containing protein [Nitrospirota bacterium]|nr:BON domain-containing protein [Nitrospirota bacterium]